MIKLIKVSKTNFKDVINLNSGKKGIHHIAPNSHTLLYSVYYGGEVRAIYSNNHLIGLVYYYTSRNTIWISRFMIDEKHQGKGLDTKSISTIIKNLKKKYDKKKISITTSNPIAMILYENLGFKKVNNKKSKKIYKDYKEHLMELIIKK